MREARRWQVLVQYEKELSMVGAIRRGNGLPQVIVRPPSLEACKLKPDTLLQESKF